MDHNGMATRPCSEQAGSVDAQSTGSSTTACSTCSAHRAARDIEPETVTARSAALCLAYPAGFIAGDLRTVPRSAAHAEPCADRPGDRTRSSRGPVAGVRLRQSRKITVDDVQARRPDGIRLASAPRLMFDLGRDLSPQDHASVVEQLLRDGRCSYAADAGHRPPAHPSAAPGVADPRRNARSAPRPSAGRFASGARARRRAAWRRRPAEVPQHWLDLPNGGEARIDIAVPAIKWGIEVDVHPDHLLLEGTARHTGTRSAVPPHRLADRAGDRPGPHRPGRPRSSSRRACTSPGWACCGQAA